MKRETGGEEQRRSSFADRTAGDGLRPERALRRGRRSRPGSRQVEGFTLIEILVVISIIGFLAAMVVLVVPLVLSDAKKKATTATLGKLKLALVQYHSEFGHDPHGETYTDPGNVAALDQTGSAYCLWTGYGLDASGGGTFDNMKAPLPGKIANPQGKLVDFLEEKGLSFAGDDTYKQWCLDAWGNRILYGLWRPPSSTSPYEPYFVLTSQGDDQTNPADDIVVKGNE